MAGRPLRARLSRRALVALLAAIATGAVIAGAIVLSAGGTAQRAAVPHSPVLLAGKPLQSANCTAWWQATPPQRDAVIAALTRSIGGPTPYGPGMTLPAGRVHRLFDRVCAPGFTGHFLLYEIYTRAAGFRSLGG